MATLQIRSSWGNRQTALLTLVCLLFAGAAVFFVMDYGSLRDFEPNGISTASRAFNQFMAVATTSIALIIPLTANLYTPKLVKLYVTHPLIVGGDGGLHRGPRTDHVPALLPQGTPRQPDHRCPDRNHLCDRAGGGPCPISTASANSCGPVSSCPCSPARAPAAWRSSRRASGPARTAMISSRPSTWSPISPSRAWPGAIARLCCWPSSP